MLNTGFLRLVFGLYFAQVLCPSLSLSVRGTLNDHLAGVDHAYHGNIRQGVEVSFALTGLNGLFHGYLHRCCILFFRFLVLFHVFLLAVTMTASYFFVNFNSSKTPRRYYLYRYRLFYMLHLLLNF